jgi:MSHA biogenesis protein MshO
MTSRIRHAGFTLVELIMVIVIMGVVGGAVAVFMKGPIDAYLDTGRRAGLADVADTTVRRIARDLHRALPNSIRPSASANTCVEFIPTKTGGRYRADGPGFLDFSAAISTFNMVGDNSTFANSALPTDQVILGGVSGDFIVVYNLGIPEADAYTGTNRSQVTLVGAVSLNERPITINPFKFPLASGSNRFHVVPFSEQVAGYVCSNVGTSSGLGTGTLSRYIANFPGTASGGCPAATVGGNITAISTMATKVSACSIDYSGSDLQRNGIVRVTLQITDGSETVSLYHEVHVDNTP